jgi:tetratricopeptide (TPR) repeat protein
VHVAIIGVVAIVAGAAVAAAPDPEAKGRAQAFLTEGAALYENGDFAGALRKFEAAYSVYPSPKLWLNIGQAQRDLRHPVEAVEAFERFLADAHDTPAPAVAEANASVAELRRQLGRLLVDCPAAGVEIALDGRSIGRTPLPRAIWAMPGRHRLTARHPGWVTIVETIAVAAGDLRRVAVRQPLAVPPPAEEESRPVVADLRAAPPERNDKALYARWPFWAVVGGAVLVAGVVVFAASGHTSVPSTPLGSQRAF